MHLWSYTSNRCLLETVPSHPFHHGMAPPGTCRSFVGVKDRESGELGRLRSKGCWLNGQDPLREALFLSRTWAAHAVRWAPHKVFRGSRKCLRTENVSARKKTLKPKSIKTYFAKQDVMPPSFTAKFSIHKNYAVI